METERTVWEQHSEVFSKKWCELDDEGRVKVNVSYHSPPENDEVGSLEEQAKLTENSFWSALTDTEVCDTSWEREMILTTISVCDGQQLKN